MATSDARQRWDGVDWAETPVWPTVARWARWLLIAAAIGVPVWMALTSPARITAPTEVGAGVVPRKIAMAGPELSGRLSDGRRYSVVAERATVADNDETVLLLTGVRAATELADGGRLDLTAQTGRFDREEDRIWLEGDVVARRSDGYVLRTEAAEAWRTAAGLAARGDQPTTIQGPEGEATSTGFSAEPGFARVRLTGPVSVRLKGGDAR